VSSVSVFQHILQLFIASTDEIIYIERGFDMSKPKEIECQISSLKVHYAT